MRRRSRRWTMGALLALAFPAAGHVSAQEAQGPARTWLAVGPVGGGGTSVSSGLGAVAQLSRQKGRRQLSLRALVLSDVAGFPDGGESDTVGEVGLLYGRAAAGAFGHASLSAGLAWVSFDRCPDDAKVACHVPGIPIVAEAALRARVLGLGLQLFGNLNPRSVHGGLALFLQLGWMP